MYRLFCLKCGDFRDYDLDVRQVTDTRDDITFNYTEIVATCKACRSELYDPITHDQNVMAHLAAYDKARMEANRDVHGT